MTGLQVRAQKISYLKQGLMACQGKYLIVGFAWLLFTDCVDRFMLVAVIRMSEGFCYGIWNMDLHALH